MINLPLVRHPRFKAASEYIALCRKSRTQDSAKLGFIFGQPGVGKSRLIADINKQYPVERDGVVDRFPVLTVKCPSRFSQSALLTRLITNLGAKCLTSANTYKLEIRAAELLFQHNVELILIDEIQDGIPISGVKDRSQLVKSIKFLTDDTGCAIVGLGTYAGKVLPEAEEQIYSRARKPFFLQDFSYDSAGERKYWSQFLMRVFADLQLHFDPSSCLAERLMLATQGDLRVLSRLMTDVISVKGDNVLSSSEETLALFADTWITKFYGCENQDSPFTLPAEKLRKNPSPVK